MATRPGQHVLAKVSEQQLMELWWSDRTMDSLCVLLGCSDTSIRDAWRVLKEQGKIPDIARNQKHLDEATIRLAEEDRKSFGFANMRPAEIKCDLLLEKLKEVHKTPR